MFTTNGCVTLLHCTVLGCLVYGLVLERRLENCPNTIPLQTLTKSQWIPGQIQKAIIFCVSPIVMLTLLRGARLDQIRNSLALTKAFLPPE